MKYQNIIYLQLLGVLCVCGTLSSYSAAMGNDSGGGVIVTDAGQLKTLAEAGYFFEAKYSESEDVNFDLYYELTQKQQDEVAKIVNELPLRSHVKNDFKEAIIGPRGTFIKSTDTDASKADYKFAKKVYSDLFEQRKQKIKPRAFELAAYSKAAKTYILPLFDMLNTRQQALILVHEALMRLSDYSVGDLEKILTFDTELYKWIAAPSLSLEQNVVDFALGLHGIIDFKNYYALAKDYTSVNILLLLDLQNQLNEPMYVQNFVRVNYATDKQIIGADVFNSYRQYSPGLSKILDGLWLRNGKDDSNDEYYGQHDYCGAGQTYYNYDDCQMDYKLRLAEPVKVKEICQKYKKSDVNKVFFYVDPETYNFGYVECGVPEFIKVVFTSKKYY